MIHSLRFQSRLGPNLAPALTLALVLVTGSLVPGCLAAPTSEDPDDLSLVAGDAGPRLDAGGRTGADAGPPAESDADAGSNPESDVDAGSDPESDAGSLADAGADRDGGPAADAGSNPQVDAGSPTPQVPSDPRPTVETATFSAAGDIADDSAIFANPVTPSLSVVIADNKDDAKGGIGVFDLQGRLLQFRQDGKIGNVDLRAEFPLGGRRIVLVGANNRTSDRLTFWELDPSTRSLSAPIGLTNPTVAPNYGFCLYHSAQTDRFFAFVTQETGKATLEQYELAAESNKVRATLVRSFQVGSIAEGCVADDELGWLYVAQEDVGIWRYGAEPTAGSTRVKIAAVGDGHLVADVEGLALAKGPNLSGYLVASSQADSRYALYDRQTHAFLRGFGIGSNGAIDAVQETDGVDICTSNLGPGFEHGALVVHDGQNTGSSTSNLKYIPLVLP